VTGACDSRWTHRLALCILLFLSGHLDAQAGHTTKIEVAGHLDDDGHFHVVEIHHITIGKGSDSDFRVFGLGADQSIVLKGITRISDDGTETPLVNQGVEGPDQYRYYPRGHVYYRYPSVTEDTTFLYRFEYELVNAVSPAWGIGAGWGPLTPEFNFESSWKRWQTLIADAKEAWPEPERRYRLDHDVLFPEQAGMNAAFEIDYDLAFDSAWREVHRDAPLGRPTAGVDYRVRRLFEYLPVRAPPSAAANREATTRLGAVLAVLATGPLLFVAILLVEFLTSDNRQIDSHEVAERLAALTPEEVQAWLEDEPPQISLEGMLSRMASEKKLVIDVDQPPADGRDQPGEVLYHGSNATEVDPSPDDGRTAEVRLQLLLPRESLPPLERACVEEVFDEDGDFTTSERVNHRIQESGRDLFNAVRNLLSRAEEKEWTSSSLLTVPLLLLGMWASFGQVTLLERDHDFVPILIVNTLALGLIVAWPKRWWHAGRVKRGLLLPLVLLAALFFSLHFTINRPYPAQMWAGSAICILAYYLAQLINSRLPSHERGRIVRDLMRIRRYAQGELKKQTPRLHDRWVPHLLALGLGSDIERWRDESGRMLLRFSHDADDVSLLRYTGIPFTGQLPEPFVSRPGWTDAFYGEPDEEDDFEDTEREDERREESDRI
jgi:hypothetical protein